MESLRGPNIISQSANSMTLVTHTPRVLLGKLDSERTWDDRSLALTQGLLGRAGAELPLQVGTLRSPVGTGFVLPSLSPHRSRKLPALSDRPPPTRPQLEVGPACPQPGTCLLRVFLCSQPAERDQQPCPPSRAPRVPADLPQADLPQVLLWLDRVPPVHELKP